MDQKWKIQLYETLSGNSPVKQFIDSTDGKTKNKIYAVIELLKEFGTRVGLPHAKKVAGTPLWELRLLGENNVRIFYISISGKTFILLHAFMKKKQKTDQKEIRIALLRLSEYKSRNIET